MPLSPLVHSCACHGRRGTSSRAARPRSAVSCVSLVAARPPSADVAGPINVSPPKPIATDKSVKYDYDIVYVRAPRKGDDGRHQLDRDLQPGLHGPGRRPDAAAPRRQRGSARRRAARGSVTDPMVSFDGEWVYYSLFHDLKGASSAHGRRRGRRHLQDPREDAEDRPADAAGVHAEHRRRRLVERLPQARAGQELPRLRRLQHRARARCRAASSIFTSNRNAFRPPKRLAAHACNCSSMDDDGGNVECIGHLNLGMALHPVVLKDGRIMFSSLESQGLRSSHRCGASGRIHPDGTNWGPLVSAFVPGGSPNAFHFQTQLSDGSIVVEEYYNQNNSGFGTLRQVAAAAAGRLRRRSARLHATIRATRRCATAGTTTAGRASAACRSARTASSRSRRFARTDEGPADRVGAAARRTRPRVGKVTHPVRRAGQSPADRLVARPGQQQYTVTSRRSTAASTSSRTARPIDEPGQMLLIKNDPKYNEQWPRALVPYKRIYGIDEPKRLAAARQRRQAVAAPARRARRSAWSARPASTSARAIPNGVGASRAASPRPSRATMPTATRASTRSTRRRTAPRSTGSTRAPTPAGTRNDDIHAIRILAMEPTTDRNRGAEVRPARSTATPASGCASSARSRVRKFATGGKQPTRPRRQSGHQLPGEDPRRRRLHVPDARQARHGAEHGADLAPGPARRGPHTTAAAATPTARSRPTSSTPRRQARLRGLRPDRRRRRC